MAGTNKNTNTSKARKEAASTNETVQAKGSPEGGGRKPRGQKAPEMRKISGSSGKAPTKRAALTPEARENQLIALAVDVAEQQLLNGTASSQVITHFLKLGSIKAQAELELLKMQRELASAKVESIKSAQHVEELYEKALSAMREYGGHGGDDEDEQ